MRYFNFILTNHANDRLPERGITKEQAWETFNHPDESKKAKNGGMEFRKYFDGFRVVMLAVQNRKNEWVVKSVWRNPPLPGTADARKRKRWEEYRNAGILGKIWVQIKQQLGF